jgi:hypothetical protein
MRGGGGARGVEIVSGLQSGLVQIARHIPSASAAAGGRRTYRLEFPSAAGCDRPSAVCRPGPQVSRGTRHTGGTGGQARELDVLLRVGPRARPGEWGAAPATPNGPPAHHVHRATAAPARPISHCPCPAEDRMTSCRPFKSVRARGRPRFDASAARTATGWPGRLRVVTRASSGPSRWLVRRDKLRIHASRQRRDRARLPPNDFHPVTIGPPAERRRPSHSGGPDPADSPG